MNMYAVFSCDDGCLHECHDMNIRGHFHFGRLWLQYIAEGFDDYMHTEGTSEDRRQM